MKNKSPWRVWIRKSDAQIGIGLRAEDSILNAIFLFADHYSNETLNPRFCQFVKDDGLTEDDFIDVGAE